ncbi:MAG: hypothetical protein AB7O65_08250 [Candidatus Korobacteraceae bacterium]
MAAEGECIDFKEAPRHLGSTRCVTGEVVAVNQGDSGTFFVNFCQDWRSCPFSAVVFPGDLRDVGDVRELDGKKIEIHGQIQEYQGRPEIILKNIRQLRGEAAKIPPIPKDFDAQRRGRFSAGSIRTQRSGSSRPTRDRRDNRRDPPDGPEPELE